MPRPAHCPGPAFFLLLRHPRRITPALHVRNRPKHPRHSIRCRSRPHRPARAVRSDRSAAPRPASRRPRRICVSHVRIVPGASHDLWRSLARISWRR